MIELKDYSKIQNIAKEVLNEIPQYINSQSNEKSISDQCIKLLESKGIYKTWYYDTPAFVLLGSRSILSISGKDYIPSNEKVGNSNLITIDLSPLEGDIWGDCARSFVFHNGKVLVNYYPQEYEIGIETEKLLHNKLIEYVKEDTTFEDLYFYMNHLIKDKGFINLDFLGNLGHSICKRKDDRIYIEKGNKNKLNSVNYFTFEPHIKSANGKWGFKHEDIYYFDGSGRLKVL